MTLFAITLRGSHVFHDCSIHCLIKKTSSPKQDLKRLIFYSFTSNIYTL